MKLLEVLDRLCSAQAHRAEWGQAPFSTSEYSDPFIRWVADLGRREGEWMRSKWIETGAILRSRQVAQ